MDSPGTGPPMHPAPPPLRLPYTSDTFAGVANSTLHRSELVILTALGLVGVALNLFLLVVYFKTPSLKSGSNLLIANLGLTHLILSSFLLIKNARDLSLPERRWDAFEGRFTCQVSGFLLVFTCGIAVATLFLISVERYLSTVHARRWSSFLGDKYKTLAVLAALWTGTALASAIPAFAHEPYVLAPSTFYCVYNWPSRSSIWIFCNSVAMLWAFFALSGILFCYASIFLTLRKAQNRLEAALNFGFGLMTASPSVPHYSQSFTKLPMAQAVRNTQSFLPQIPTCIPSSTGNLTRALTIGLEPGSKSSHPPLKRNQSAGLDAISALDRILTLDTVNVIAAGANVVVAGTNVVSSVPNVVAAETKNSNVPVGNEGPPATVSQDILDSSSRYLSVPNHFLATISPPADTGLPRKVRQGSLSSNTQSVPFASILQGPARGPTLVSKTTSMPATGSPSTFPQSLNQPAESLDVLMRPATRPDAATSTPHLQAKSVPLGPIIRTSGIKAARSDPSPGGHSPNSLGPAPPLLLTELGETLPFASADRGLPAPLHLLPPIPSPPLREGSFVTSGNQEFPSDCTSESLPTDTQIFVECPEPSSTPTPPETYVASAPGQSVHGQKSSPSTSSTPPETDVASAPGDVGHVPKSSATLPGPSEILETEIQPPDHPPFIPSGTFGQTSQIFPPFKSLVNQSLGGSRLTIHRKAKEPDELSSDVHRFHANLQRRLLVKSIAVVSAFFLGSGPYLIIMAIQIFGGLPSSPMLDFLSTVFVSAGIISNPLVFLFWDSRWRGSSFAVIKSIRKGCFRRLCKIRSCFLSAPRNRPAMGP